MKIRNSIYIILFLTIISTVILVTGAYSTYRYISAKNEMIKEVKYKSDSTLAKLNRNIKNFILSYSIHEYNHLISNEMNNPNVIAIIVNDYKMAEIIGESNFFSGKIKLDNELIVDYDNQNLIHNELLKNSYYTSRIDVRNDSEGVIGNITMYNSDKEVEKRLKEIIIENIKNAIVVSSFLTIFLFMAIRIFLLKYIFRIVRSLEKRDKEGIPISLLKVSGPSEIAALSLTINKMIVGIRKSNTQLNDLKERLLLAWDGVNDGIWDWHIKNDKAYFSKNWKEILGYKEDELEDKPESFFNLLHEDDKILVQDHLERHFKDPEKNIYALEVRMRCKDGSYKWILTRGKANFDEHHNPVRMVGSHTDITTRKEFEKILHDQKEEFETIFHYAKDGLAILDLETNFLEFNESYLKMTGYSKEELLKKSCIELIINEEKHNAKKALEEVLEKGFIYDFEKPCVSKDGKIVITNMSIALLPDRNRLVISAKDVTDRKLLESQAKLASMGEMIGNIAHQWRQPLSAISTVASGIKVKNEFGMLDNTDDIINDMDIIIGQTQYLSKTIDDFRNFIKEGDKKHNILISTILDKAFSIVNSTIVNNNITVILDAKEDFYIDAYENELIQALINILNNAKDVLKEKNEEDRLIFVYTKKLDDKNILSIKDSGDGIDEKYFDKIFEPYFTTKHKSIGTGIGLSMVYQILTEHHNASIAAFNESFIYKDKQYKGARFDIVFKK